MLQEAASADSVFAEPAAGPGPPELSLEHTHRLLDALATRFAARSAAQSGVDAPATFSRGISETRADTDLTELLLRADRDLLHSKQSRHRTVFGDGAPATQDPPGQSANGAPEMSS